MARCQNDHCISVHEATINYLKFACISAYFGEVSYLVSLEQRLFLKTRAFPLEPLSSSFYATKFSFLGIN